MVRTTTFGTGIHLRDIDARVAYRVRRSDRLPFEEDPTSVALPLGVVSGDLRKEKVVWTCSISISGARKERGRARIIGAFLTLINK